MFLVENASKKTAQMENLASLDDRIVILWPNMPHVINVSRFIMFTDGNKFLTGSCRFIFVQNIQRTLNWQFFSSRNERRILGFSRYFYANACFIPVLKKIRFI